MRVRSKLPSLVAQKVREEEEGFLIEKGAVTDCEEVEGEGFSHSSKVRPLGEEDWAREASKSSARVVEDRRVGFVGEEGGGWRRLPAFRGS